MLMPKNFLCVLYTVLLLSLNLQSVFAEATKENNVWITRNAVTTDSGHFIPSGAFGIVQIESPRQATLLDLRGMAGQGDVILRSDETGYCLTFPLRFVAGDFGGDTISAQTIDPVIFVIKSRRVAKELVKGHDIVSEDFRISRNDHPSADIIIESGLSESFNFVFNPGRNLLAEIWGVETTRIPCSPQEK